MWPFSKRKKQAKKKRRKHVELPLYSKEPMSAYVERLSPSEFKGVKLPRKLGRYDYIHEFDTDLRPEVSCDHGGGTYLVKFVLQFNKRVYMGQDTFQLPFEPLIDGMPIEPKEKR